MNRALRSTPDRLTLVEARLEELAAALRSHDAAMKEMRAARAVALAQVKPAAPTITRMAAICEAVGDKFGFSLDQIRGRDNGSLLNEARQEAMRLMAEAGHSLPKIGRYLDGRDHTTILHGIRKARARLEVKR